jgi:peptidoglycan hydrolase-like protein with peptidoglycan-binding domain
MTRIVAAVLAGVLVAASAGVALAQSTVPGGGSTGPGGAQSSPQPGGVQGSMDIQAAQEQLRGAGFNPGPVNGLLNEETRTAIRQYQKSKGLPETGDLDQETRSALMAPATSGTAPPGKP